LSQSPQAGSIALHQVLGAVLRDWYELKFALAFRSKFATEFQDFFASIMERGYPTDFQKVKPYGTTGDKKCDGYRRSQKRVYQVYAPEKMQVGETNAKIDQDFSGAIAHWAGEMTSWVFVHNQWRGVPPDVLQKILAIDGTHGIGVVAWCEPELHDEFFGLTPENQAVIFGPAPTPQSFARIELKDIIPVVNVIAQLETLHRRRFGRFQPESLGLIHFQVMSRVFSRWGARRENL
jgi:hypothetical protein